MFFEIVLLGRGGQGVVTTSTILAEAYLREGKNVQAFPEFGPERAGAPVRAYVRVSDEPIEVYTPVEQADAAIVLDEVLLKKYPPDKLLKSDGMLLLNSEAVATGPESRLRAYRISAGKIAKTHGRPLSVGIALLGAYSAISRMVSLPSLAEAVSDRLSVDDVKVLEEGFREATAIV